MKINKVFSFLIAFAFTFPIFIIPTSIDVYAEKSTSTLHVSAIAPDEVLAANEDICVQFKKITSSTNGLNSIEMVLTEANNYSMSFTMEANVMYEVSFSENLKDYRVLGIENQYTPTKTDEYISLTFVRDNTAITTTAPENTVDMSSYNPEAITVLQTYLEQAKILEEYPDEFKSMIKMVDLVKRIFIKRQGKYYNQETWDTLTESEKELFIYLVKYPNDFIKKADIDSYTREDMEKDISIKEFNLESDYYLQYHNAVLAVWEFMWNEYVTTGDFTDFFAMYMDMKNGNIVESTTTTQITSNVSSSQTTTISEVTTTTTTATEKNDNENYVKNAVKTTVNRNIISIVILVILAVVILILRWIIKKKKSEDDDII